MNVLKRLEKLEQQAIKPKEAIAVFRVLVDIDRKRIPVKAWKNSNTGELISRNERESDDELLLRAKNAANGDSVRFMPVI